MKLLDGDLVIVEWIDSSQSTDIWYTLSEAKSHANEISLIITVGFVVENTDEHISTSHSWFTIEGEEPSIAGLFQIPWGCVYSIKKIYTVENLIRSLNENEDKSFEKRCSRCRQILSSEKFVKCVSTKDGLGHYCKECYKCKGNRSRKLYPPKEKAIL